MFKSSLSFLIQCLFQSFYNVIKSLSTVNAKSNSFTNTSRNLWDIRNFHKKYAAGGKLGGYNPQRKDPPPLSRWVEDKTSVEYLKNQDNNTNFKPSKLKSDVYDQPIDALLQEVFSYIGTTNKFFVEYGFDTNTLVYEFAGSGSASQFLIRLDHNKGKYEDKSEDLMSAINACSRVKCRKSGKNVEECGSTNRNDRNRSSEEDENLCQEFPKTYEDNYTEFWRGKTWDIKGKREERNVLDEILEDRLLDEITESFESKQHEEEHFQYPKWHGLLLDAANSQPKINLHKHILCRENIVPVFQKYKVPKSYDIHFSDMDSHDIFVMEAVLRAGYRPRVVLTETCRDLPPNLAIAKWDPSFFAKAQDVQLNRDSRKDTENNQINSLKCPGKTKFATSGSHNCAYSASAGAWRLLMEQFGYRAVTFLGGGDILWVLKSELLDINKANLSEEDIPEFEFFYEDEYGKSFKGIESFHPIKEHLEQDVKQIGDIIFYIICFIEII